MVSQSTDLRNETNKNTVDARSINGRFTVSQKKLTEIDEAFIQEWSSLCNRSAEPNAFMTPEFLIPAATVLNASDRPRLLCVRDEKDQLVGFAAFHGVAASRMLPLPHLQTYESIHSFRGGWLVDAARVEQTVDALVESLADSGWYAVEFTNQRMDSPVIKAVQKSCLHRKYFWTTFHEEEVPGFSPKLINDEYFLERWSKNRRKSARKNIKRLEQLGEWDFRMVSNGPELGRAVDRFLALEHAGWKEGLGTSLRSQRHQERFFREVLKHFQKTSTAFFAELWLDGKVISSSVNLISGNIAFAFKIGWDPEFGKVSPGTILETQLIQRAPQILPNIQFVDGCASSDSYVSGIWPERIRIGTGLLTLNRRSRWVAAGFDQIKSVKRQVLGTK